MADLLVIVPSRGRPESVRRVVDAWLATDGYADADLVFVIDADDPQHHRYFDHDFPDIGPDLRRAAVSFAVLDAWEPMVHKLNTMAARAAHYPDGYPALAFMGDDHLPRSAGWAGRYLAELRELGTGIVYGDDLLQGERLPTQWAMTSDIVRALGRMVPADVEHLYCDNAVMALGLRAECLRYLPDVVIEHVHPIAGKAQLDDGYRRVNRPEQYRRDGAAYRAWVRDRLDADADLVRGLRARKEVPSGSGGLHVG